MSDHRNKSGYLLAQLFYLRPCTVLHTKIKMAIICCTGQLRFLKKSFIPHGLKILSITFVHFDPRVILHTNIYKRLRNATSSFVVSRDLPLDVAFYHRFRNLHYMQTNSEFLSTGGFFRFFRFINCPDGEYLVTSSV